MMQFSTIMADPAWTFATYSDNGKGRSPEQHYACMPLDDIKRLPVGDVAAKDAMLFLWAVDPLLDKAFEVMAAWGFTFKTVGFYWVKVNRGMRPHVGMGYWTRANPEVCLLGTRGKPVRLARDVQRLVLAPRGQHSAKPHEVYRRIERLTPGPYLELFARYARHGGHWFQWGNEVGKTGGTPNLFDLPGFPARRAATDHALFESASIM
jgi:N6-adenosine-specific RNA methylase IME4